jgi:hypothetical protein
MDIPRHANSNNTHTHIAILQRLFPSAILPIVIGSQWHQQMHLAQQRMYSAEAVQFHSVAIQSLWPHKLVEHIDLLHWEEEWSGGGGEVTNFINIHYGK